MRDINLNAYKPETGGENREKESEKLLDVVARTFQFPQWQLKASGSLKSDAQGGSGPPYQFRQYITTSVSDNSLSAWQFLWPPIKAAVGDCSMSAVIILLTREKNTNHIGLLFN